eukprot:6070630-Amphidinium_carterae.1
MEDAAVALLGVCQLLCVRLLVLLGSGHNAALHCLQSPLAVASVCSARNKMQSAQRRMHCAPCSR